MSAHLRRVFAAIAIIVCLSYSYKSRADEIVVVFNSDWAPYSMGAVEEVEGILPDLVNELLGTHMGLSVRVQGYPWARVQHLVEQGYADVFITVPTQVRLEYALSSEEIAYQVEMRAIVKQGSDAETLLRETPTPTSLKSLRTCDILGNGWGKAYAANHDITPVIASKVSNCLLMVKNGRADTSIQSTVVAELEINSHGLDEDLVILPELFGQMSFTLLLSKKSAYGQEFLDHFDEVVKRMKDDGSYDTLVRRLHDIQVK